MRAVETDPESDVVPPVAEKRGRSVSHIILAVKGIVSIVILAALYYKLGTQLPPLSSIEPSAIVAASAILLLQPALIGARWQQILRIYGVVSSFGAVTVITWISVFANQFLPAGIGGDAVRVLFARRDGVKMSAAFTSILIDRIMALIALALLVVVFAPFLGNIVDRRVLVGIGVAMVVGMVAAFAVSGWLRRHSGSRFARWPVVARLIGALNYVLFVLSDPLRCSIALLMAASVHFLSAVAFVWVARGIGIGVDRLDLMAIALVLTFVQIIPISIGGWGLREAAAVGLFASYGVDGGHAVLASLFLGSAYLIASLPGAVFWLVRPKNDAAGV